MMLCTVRQTKEHQVSAPTPSSAQPSPNPVNESLQRASPEALSNQGPAAANTPAAPSPKPKLILVAHYKE